MEKFHEKLGELIRRTGLTQADICKRIKLSGKYLAAASLSNAVNGKTTLDPDTIELIAPILKLTEAETTELVLYSCAARSKSTAVELRMLDAAAKLQQIPEDQYKASETVEAPVWNCIKAGTTDLQQITSEAVGVTEMSLKEKQRGCFCMRVCGASMEGDRIFSGDIAFFQPLNGEGVNDRDIYAVEVEGQPCWVVKKITRLPGGKIGLVSSDGSAPVEIDADSTRISVKGVLTKVVSERRKNIQL